MSQQQPTGARDSVVHAESSDRALNIRQFIRFCLTGAVSTAIYYGLFLLTLPFLPTVGAYAVGYATGVVFNLCVHMLFTFRTGFQWTLLFGFLLIYLVTMGLGGLVLRGLIGLGVDAPVAGFVVIFANLFFNFGGMRALAMRSQSRPAVNAGHRP